MPKNTKEDPKGKSNVSITVDNVELEIHRSRQKVGEIKTLVGVPLADELNQQFYLTAFLI